MEGLKPGTGISDGEITLLAKHEFLKFGLNRNSTLYAGSTTNFSLHQTSSRLGQVANMAGGISARITHQTCDLLISLIRQPILLVLTPSPLFFHVQRKKVY